ncbi:MAG: hypothetical protein RLZZ127_1696 [Planctomycetota bacterium]
MSLAERPRIPVALDDRLPLTCTREGVCCRGHRIPLLPWELARIARHHGVDARTARERWTEHGVRLAVVPDRGSFRCVFADHPLGCGVHGVRPLPCRLFPLARERTGDRVAWWFPGPDLPCLSRCPSVVAAPPVTVRAWLATQDLDLHTRASDAAGDLVAGLHALIDRLGGAPVPVPAGLTELVAALGPEWYDLATIPDLEDEDPRAFAAGHGRILATHASRDPEAASARLALVAALLAQAAGIAAP